MKPKQLITEDQMNTVSGWTLGIWGEDVLYGGGELLEKLSVENMDYNNAVKRNLLNCWNDFIQLKDTALDEI